MTQTVSPGATKVKDMPSRIIDGDRGANYLKGYEFTDDGFCLFLSAKNVTRDGFDFAQKQFITSEKDGLLRKGKLERDDVVLTTRGTVGNVALYDSSVPYDNVRINSGMVVIRCDKEKILPKYLYFVLKSGLFQNQVESFRSGSAQPQLPIRDMQNMKLPLPSLDEQENVVSQIGTIDEKIELNRQMNETLEQMGQALFRHHFIDNPEAETWDRRYLGDFVEIVNGASYKSAELQPSSNALVSLKSVGRGGGFSRRGYKEYTGKMKDAQVVHDGDLIVAHTDLTQKAEVAGYPALVDGADQYEKVAISMDLVKVVPRSSELSSSVVYFLLKTREFQDHKMGYISGSTVLHLNKKCIPDYKIALPNDESSLHEISEKFDRFMEQIKVDNQQIQTLTTLRDTLLPWLISGKVGV